MIDSDSAEMDAVIAGFRDTMKDELVEDPNEILQKWGPELNKVLQERAAGVVDKMKEEGDDFAKNFQECNDDAVKVRGGEGGGGQGGRSEPLGERVVVPIWKYTLFVYYVSYATCTTATCTVIKCQSLNRLPINYPEEQPHYFSSSFSFALASLRFYRAPFSPPFTPYTLD